MIEAFDGSDRNKYWNKFYEDGNKTIFPSQFAVMLASTVSSEFDIVDLGCGNGRDTFFFSQLGYRVVGIDQSEVAIRSNLSRSLGGRQDNVRFVQANFSDREKIELAANINGIKSKKIYYCRFVLHSITDDEEDKLIGVPLEDRDIAALYDKLRAEAEGVIVAGWSKGFLGKLRKAVPEGTELVEMQLPLRRTLSGKVQTYWYALIPPARCPAASGG